MNKNQPSGFIVTLGIAFSLCFVGVLLVITIVGAIIGIPLMIFGAILFIVAIPIKLLSVGIKLYKEIEEKRKKKPSRIRNHIIH